MELKTGKQLSKPQKLRILFAGYTAAFCIGTIILAALLLAAYVMLISVGIILPANYREAQLSAVRDRIARNDAVTPDMIPETCSYGIFTLQGKLISGDFNENEAAVAWNITQVQNLKQHSGFFYSSIKRQNEICIVRYTLIMQFNSPVLRHFLPAPEILLFIVFGIGFLLEVFLLASVFGRKLTEKLHGLQNATEKIQNQDLNFSVESSGIYEIDNVLNSIEKMKEALKVSLQKQWELEHARREQVSALAHDIKMPLTIIHGNADLLIETDLTAEQNEYISYIMDSSRQMERYVTMLVEISRVEAGYSLNKKELDTEEFIAEIHKQISALSIAKKLSLKFDASNLPQSFSADSDMLKRAIMNIASNAVDFSPEKGTIIFNVTGTGDTIHFCMIDSGNGFSADALENAIQQFYMGDKSRASKGHYGMGLFIANSIAMQHGGTLLLENSAETGGGKVMISIPTAVS